MSKAMNYRWEAKKVEELIEWYRLEECLWNCADKDYFDSDKKKSALRRISEKLGGISEG